ncbi:MAG: NUDIX pyrophosphatase [bacterium]|nr:NUDIX pyrophosphatase [bacterium]
MKRAPFEVAIILFRKTKKGSFEYAIFKRSDTEEYAGYWQVVAGGGEEGESHLQAAKRETLEETGIKKDIKFFLLKTKSSIPVYHFAAQKYWPKDLYVIPGYYYAINGSDTKIVLSDEHSEYKWVPYKTAAKLLHWEDDKTALWELNERLLNNDIPLEK